FFLESFALRYAIHAGVENPDAQLLEIIEDCIEDLGLDRGLARDLERQAGWITLRDSNEEPYVRQSDVIKAGSAFVLRVVEEFGRRRGDDARPRTGRVLGSGRFAERSGS